jgi:hypothetical protein
MGATKRAGLMTERRTAHAAKYPERQLADGESSMSVATGDEVAWVNRSRAGVAVGLSSVHRVFALGKTYCGSDIPPADQRLPILVSLNVCSKCDRMHARNVEREAADAHRLGVA